MDDGSYIDDRTGTNFARQFFLDPHTTKKQGAKSNELQRTACSKLLSGVNRLNKTVSQYSGMIHHCMVQ